MGIFKRGVLFVCMLMLPVNAFSYQGATSRHVLDNGLTVIITEMPSSSMVSIYTLVKTGSATEGEFLGSGISHFVEHMLFKGTHTQAVGEIAAKIQAMGGTINASTGMDYTIYTITVPHDKFEDGLKIEADMIINPTFDKEEVEKEREVIHSEMRLYKDMPDRKIDELSFNTVFERHPYKLPVIGYEDLFDSVTRDDLVKYYQTHYTANNSILSIAGNVKTEDILPKIKEAFKGYKRNFDNPRNLVQEPVQLAQRYVEEEFEANITRVSMNYRSVSIRHPDVFALDVLASVLSEGASSRLYKNIYKKKDYITGLYASNYTPYDPGIFEISMSVDNKRTQEAISDVLDEINLIKTKGITKQELDKVIANEEAEYVYSHLTTYHIAHAQAIDEAFTGDFQFSKNYIEHLKNVTPKDVKRVASQYLTDNSLSIVILKPKDEKKPEENKQEKSAVGELKKIVLDNGVTLFLKEDRTMPYVTANFLIKGGSLLDKEENAGTFGMLGSLLIKGTKSKTEGQIAEITDSRGIQLSGYAGGLTLVVSASFLPKDTHIVLSLTEDIL